MRLKSTGLFSIAMFSLSLCSFAQSDQVRTVIQKGHEAVVKSVDYTPNGDYLLTASRDKTIKLWETSTKREVLTYRGHDHTVNGLSISEDGQWLASSSADKTSKVWNLKTGEEIFSTPEGGRFKTDVTFSPDGQYIVTGGYDPQVQIWDFRKNELVKEIKVNPEIGLGYGINLAYSPNGQQLAIGEDNKTLKVYNTNSWELLYELVPALGSCGGCATYVAFSSDGKWLVKAANDGELSIYQANSGQLVRQIKEEVEDIRSVQFSPNDQQIMLATEKAIYVYDVESGAETLTFSPPVKEINDASYSPDGSRVTVGGNDHMATSYEISDGKLAEQYSGILQAVDKGGINYDPDNYWQSHLAKYVRLKNKLLFSKDGKKLIRGKFGRSAKMWEIKSGKTLVEYLGHEKAVLCTDLSPNGEFLVTGGGDGLVALWEVSSGKKIKDLKRHRDPVFEVKFNHAGDRVVSAGWDGYALVWDVKTGDLISDIYFGQRAAYSINFSPNDLYLIAGLLDKKLEMWEIDSKRLVKELIGHTDVVTEINFLGEKMLTTSWDGSARLWDLSTSLQIARYKGKKPLNTGIISKNGERAYVAGEDQQVIILDGQTMKLQDQLSGHQSDILSVRLSTEEDLLVSNSADGVTKFWDLSKKKEFFEHIHIGKKDWMAKSTQGYFNATDGARGVIHYVQGLKTYGVDQFFDDFYRPDLVPDLFSTRGKGGKREGILQKINQFPPPEVKLGLKLRGDMANADIFMKGIDTGGGLREMKLFHNGKRINARETTIKKGKNSNEKEWVIKLKVPLIGGRNFFALSGVSEGGTESAVVEKEVFSEQSTPGAKCHVLAVGINDYENNSLDLNYAKADAASFAEAIQQSQQTLFKEVKVRTLFDTDATKTNILGTVQEMTKEIGINDVFVFYYAGHGSVVDNRFFFIPTETNRLFDIKGLEKSALEASVLQEAFQKIKALKQVIIMDACHSGKSVELLAQRGSVEEKAIAQLSRSAGVHVLASAGSDQYASEFKQLEHGVFTFALLKALGGAADGTPKEGKITLFELKSYLDDQVPEMSMQYKGKPQYPYTFSKGNDFPLKLVGNEE